MRLPYNATAPVAVLAADSWQVELGAAGDVCDSFGSGAPFVFRNTSDETETIQGGSFASPTPVGAGATANLGTAWPQASEPLGVLQITAGGTQVSAYLTEGTVITGGECSGTANTNLVTG